MVWFNMCNMKNLFCVLLSGVLCVMPAMAASSYKSQVADCDSRAEKDLSKPENYSNVRMVQITDTQTECYKQIVFKIIDTEYSQNSDNMKQHFTDYINLAGEMVGFIRRPDSCYPHCGTSVGIDAATARRDAALFYINTILKHAEPM